MPPDNRTRPSLDGFRRVTAAPVGPRKPDYRPDHELPAPEPTPMLTAPEVQLQTYQSEPQNVPASRSSLDMDDDKPNMTVKRPHRLNKWIIITSVAALLAVIAAFISVFVWYQGQLAPVTADTTKVVRFAIQPGSGLSVIADKLQSEGVIRSEVAFGVYMKLSGNEGKLKAGVYNLHPSQSTPAIVDHLIVGKQDSFNVTFLPGDILANNRQELVNLGLYSTAEIDAALNKKYHRPLFANKPQGADLEGYLYGETIAFDASATPETILNRFFDEYETVIDENKLVDAYQKRGLTLYEGITLASIVQRETSRAENQKNVARVFMNRMDKGMNLGSDVTYQYAAKKLGINPDPRLDSPYNTRIHAGLPPGPIASPGKSALLAVANPANNDYLYFLSGDDNEMYYAKTDAEHQQNIVQHCHVKCATP